MIADPEGSSSPLRKRRFRSYDPVLPCGLVM
jgi:hypothetical protein